MWQASAFPEMTSRRTCGSHVFVLDDRCKKKETCAVRGDLVGCF